MRGRYPLWLHIGITFTVLIVIVCTALGIMGYRMVQKTTRTAVLGLAEQITRITELDLKEMKRAAHVAIATELRSNKTFEEHLLSWRLVAPMLESFPFFNTIFMGYENGDFFSITAPRVASDIQTHQAPAETSFIVHSFRNKKSKIASRVLFYDKNLRVISENKNFHSDFDPRSRSWYTNAKYRSGYFISDLYFYYGTAKLGVTISKRGGDSERVAGVDINVASLSRRLDFLVPTPRSRIAVINTDASLVAYTSNVADCAVSTSLMLTKEKTPTLFSAFQKYKDGARGLLSSIDVNGVEWLFYINEIDAFNEGNKNIILLAMPVEEVMQDSKLLLNRTIWMSALILLISLPIIWYVAQRIVKPLDFLCKEAEKIQSFNFKNEKEKTMETSVREINSLFRVISKLRENIKHFLNVNSAISNERDSDELLDLILIELSDVADADGGVIALLNEKQEYLPSINFFRGNTIEDERIDEESCLHQISIEEFREIMPVVDEIRENDLIRTRIKRESPSAKLQGVAPFFEKTDTEFLDIIHLRLSNVEGTHLGVLTFIKVVDVSGECFQENHISFLRALANSASVALENRRLFDAERNLLTSIVQVIAGAIDAKSPYTGAHCQRVPVIFNMILDAANNAEEGPLRNFSCTDEEREEANFAAWLHDCGKVTTPEYVVDKATKLETIYDRIHEIRTRFEILKRDVEIVCLRDILNGANPQERKRQAEVEAKKLDDEFAFVAKYNDGSESVNDEVLGRLRAIGKRTWLRTLDKRLGVSRDELARMGDVGETLPVLEELLADKAEHIIRSRPLKDSNEAHSSPVSGLHCEVIQNRGELYNLSITRGTLNAEERATINDHVTQTRIMLNKLPLPKHLRNIPTIAGSHHETLDGKGYPRNLKGEEIDIKARMLVIADIFEALTAADRPYKSAKKLSEALKIMEWFRDNNCIDPDLYELFMKEQIPQKYAKEYLRPDQYDL